MTTIDKVTLHSHASQLIEASMDDKVAIINRIMSHYRDAESFIQLVGAFVGITRALLDLVFEDEADARKLLHSIEKSVREQDAMENGHTVVIEPQP